MSYPVFASGDVLNASDMNAVGLWRVKSQTIASGVSYVDVTSCFSSDFDHYKMIITIYGSTASFATYQMLNGTTPETGAVYYRRGWYASGGVLGAYNAGGLTSVFFAQYGNLANEESATTIEFYNPQKTKRTGATVRNVDISSSDAYDVSTLVATTTAYTGIRLIPNSGTFSGGTIRIYGYRN